MLYLTTTEEQMATYLTHYAKKEGLKRENAKHNLVLSVVPDDVKKAQAKDSQNCAFACAAMRNDKGIEKVFFFKSVAWVQTARRLVRYNLPQSVQKEIVAFDRFKVMEPGVYSLSAPPKSAHPKAQAKRDAKRKAIRATGKTGRTQLLRHITGNVRFGLNGGLVK